MKKQHHVPNFQISMKFMVIITGFVGGVVFCLLGYAMYAFKFISINPEIILFTWKNQFEPYWLKLLFVIILYGIVSIVISYLYYLLWKNRKSFWWGVLYGILLFLIGYLLSIFLYPNYKWIEPINTTLSLISLFIWYGLFIGYSISYEYNEQQVIIQNEGKSSE